MRLRLNRFAELQADWRRQGWQIVETETKFVTATLVVDGQPFEITGQIDRVDRQVDTGEFAVFDYKTADSANEPEKTHRRSGEWVDLQLPLYRHLLRTRPYYQPQPIRLGYILVPADLKKSKFAVAEWSDDELHEADVVAHDVIRKIRRGEFWPPRDPPPPYAENTAAICQDHVSERWSWEEAGV
jgi:hypothetical protein